MNRFLSFFAGSARAPGAPSSSQGAAGLLTDLQRHWIAFGVLLLAIALAVGSTAAVIASRAVPPIENCLFGQELALHKEAVLGTVSPQATLLQTDELNYLRAADKLARGQTATDFLGDFVAAARTAEPDPTLLRDSPVYRLARKLGEGAGTDRPSFVSYRSVVFPAMGVPILKWTGCTAQGLKALRYAMLPFRALLVVAAGLLAWLIVPRFKLLALSLTSLAVATDAQLNEAGSSFMPDMPGAALVLLALCGMLLLPSRRGTLFAVGLGCLLALTVLVKSDFLYVLPITLGVSVLSVEPARRRAHLKQAGVVFAAYALVMGAYMARNHHHTGAWFVTSKDTINLYLANIPQAQARDFRYATSAAEWAALERIPDEQQAALKAFGPEIALRQFCRTQFIDLVAADPWRLLRAFRDRLLIFLQGAGVVHYPAIPGASAVLGLAIMALALVASPWLLLAGLQRRSPAAIVAVSYGLGLAIISLVFVEPRYLSHLFAMATVIAVTTIVGAAGSLLGRTGGVR